MLFFQFTFMKLITFSCVHGLGQRPPLKQLHTYVSLGRYIANLFMCNRNFLINFRFDIGFWLFRNMNGQLAESVAVTIGKKSSLIELVDPTTDQRHFISPSESPVATRRSSAGLTESPRAAPSLGVAVAVLPSLPRRARESQLPMPMPPAYSLTLPQSTPKLTISEPSKHRSINLRL